MAVLWAVPAWAVQGDAGEDLDAQHHEERYGIFNILDYGAVSDAPGVTDDTAAIQSAYDACTAAGTLPFPASAAHHFPYVYIPRGTFEIADEDAGADDGIGLDFDSGPHPCSVKGDGPNISVLVWTDPDAATQTAMRINNSINGGSYTEYVGFTMRELDSVTGEQPAIFMDFIDSIDSFQEIRNMSFRGSATAAIKVSNGFVNFHITDVRFDFWDTYAIQLDVPGTQNKSSFVLDRWTADARPQAPNGANSVIGFIEVEMLSSATTNNGSYLISNGRFEAASGLGFENSRFFNLDTEFTGGLDVTLLNVTVDVGVDNGECLFGMQASAPSASFGYNATVIASGMPGWHNPICGDWGTEVTNLNSRADGMNTLWTIHDDGMVIQSKDNKPLTLVGATSDRVVLAIHNRDDAESADLNTRAPTFSIDEDGDMLWSSNPGSADNDTGLTITANKIAAQSSDEIEAGTLDATANMEIPSGTDPAATCTVGEIYLDTDGVTTSTTCGTAGAGPALCICGATNTWTPLE